MYSKFVVARKVRESQLVCSLYLKAVDDAPLLPFEAGQHLMFKLQVPGCDIPLFRNYSFSDAWNEKYYRVSVKKETGLGSSYIFDIIKEGDVLEAKGPQGTFIIQPGNEPVLLIAGGIGITPLLCMLKTITREHNDRRVTLLYGVNDGENHSFKDELLTIKSTYPNCSIINFYANVRENDEKENDYNHSGFIDLSVVNVADYKEFYICGPEVMMQHFKQKLGDTGVPASSIFTESFVAPAEELEKPEANVENGAACINYNKSQVSLYWDGRFRSLLEFSEANGIEINSGCLFGDCGTCLTKLLDGEVRYLHPTMVNPGPGNCLPCSCIPLGNISLDV